MKFWSWKARPELAVTKQQRSSKEIDRSFIVMMIKTHWTHALAQNIMWFWFVIANDAYQHIYMDIFLSFFFVLFCLVPRQGHIIIYLRVDFFYLQETPIETTKTFFCIINLHIVLLIRSQNLLYYYNFGNVKKRRKKISKKCYKQNFVLPSIWYAERGNRKRRNILIHCFGPHKSSVHLLDTFACSVNFNMFYS